MEDIKPYSVYEYNRTERETGKCLARNKPVTEADGLAMQKAQQLKKEKGLKGKIKRLTKEENCVFDVCGEEEGFIVICKYPTREYPIKKEAV